jgi:hypothetical protein
MKIAKAALACAALMSAGILPALGDDGNGRPGTVNYFAPAQKTRAFAAAAKAGYTPILVQAFQDGNFFLTARKEGQSYGLTVTSSGQVYASTPMVAAS